MTLLPFAYRYVMNQKGTQDLYFIHAGTNWAQSTAK